MGHPCIRVLLLVSRNIPGVFFKKQKKMFMSSFVFYPTHIYWQAVCDIASSATLIQEFIKSAVKGDVQSPED